MKVSEQSGCCVKVYTISVNFTNQAKSGTHEQLGQIQREWNLEPKYFGSNLNFNNFQKWILDKTFCLYSQILCKRQNNTYVPSKNQVG